ncbi:MAG: DUF998 domain-containing protein, partial [Treponemataceae bacterium]|nr:DUF998 domain-containing protein [Treponemataceae bacterium]
MDSGKFMRLLSLSGVLAAVFYFLHVYFGVQNYPHYNSLSQAVSDLTAIDAPSFTVAFRFSSLYSLFAILGTTILYLIVAERKEINKTFRRGIGFYTIMNWVSGVGYTLFPLSSKGFQGTVQDIMHFYVVTIAVVVFSLLSLLFIFIGGWRERRTKGIAVSGFIALLSILFGSIGIGIFPQEYFGLFERFSAFSVVLYT